MMGVEHMVEGETAGETDALRRNIRQCNFVHHKFHMI
jgi:hypothetical protein